MFDQFSHFISYGSTDQKTVRMLSGLFDGLLVPGTIAAFQVEGTKGFVLSLSAMSDEPYVIDSRFPLFQNRLLKPKKSHKMLADILNRPDLIKEKSPPTPLDFDDEMVSTIAESWIDFNTQFINVKTKTFQKYADRLGEDVSPELRKVPKYILPPYLMVHDLLDGWWNISNNLWEHSKRYAGTKGIERNLRRVIAASSPDVLAQLIKLVSEEEIVIWVSDLDEFRLSSEKSLGTYTDAISDGKSHGKRIFALYGGFFAVLVSRYGLAGASHGIGYGEFRDYVELPSSGAAPARYYVPLLHRYIGVDLAQMLWQQFPQLISCPCEECLNGSPSFLDYHALMRHSVRSRHREILDWQDLPDDLVIFQLREAAELFREAASKFVAPFPAVDRIKESYRHLEMWANVIDRHPS